MDYFLLKQDTRYVNVPQLIDVHKNINIKDINLSTCDNISDTVILNVKADKDSAFLDILDKPLFLMSDDLKNIIEKYDANIYFKTIPLIDLQHERQKNYCLPIFEELDALSEESEFNMDRSVIKKIVLDSKKIKGKKIFKIKNEFKTLIVVRLDVAESILRRGFTGIKLEKLCVS
ncbi:imm11 family protein [Clostridium frigidicarnis]|uniref:Immunity MXAN-0049 protein domain-containing protein n=1 Tax=Clostridium frigidicarnis TaxID=84698 RepID=A0A1I0VVY9_9CLOT|nr:DUF1629 domain-containing protein [Clostridium frigidicarnis]SFA80060.1 hypothetical protein SAMN04488528_100343 [Clostridium frigidicarnis]